MKLERLQFWTDVVCVVFTVLCVVSNSILKNWQAVIGWGCAAIMSLSALLAHRQTRHWWRKYCRAMGWEKEGVDET